MFFPACSDLYWENRFHVEDYKPDVSDPTDRFLKRYKLPEKIEQFLEEGRYNNMERMVTEVMSNIVYTYILTFCI